MPVYEYYCPDCRQTLTVRCRFSEMSTAICPTCQCGKLERIISQIAVVRSRRERVSDVSWVDRNLAQRIRKKVSGDLNAELEATVGRMESGS